MTWRIELSDTNDDLPIVTVIKAQAIWKRLSKAAQEAVEAAYPDRPVKGHRNTRAALERHGWVVWSNTAQACVLSEAGRAVAKWNVQVKP
jgi:hypothetical protein